MGKRLPVEEVEFKNHLGQTITPGETVIIVTSGYNHSVNIKPGVYLGKKNEGVSCRVVEHHTHYRHKETGEEVGHHWFEDAKKRGYFAPDYPSFDSDKYPHPNYKFEWHQRNNNADYDAAMKIYNDAYQAYRDEYDAYRAQVQAAAEKYEDFKVPYDRYTTLQLNRIYKTDTSVFELSV